MEIKGLKKAVGNYQRLNVDPYSAFYGELMLDTSTGEVWTDEFYSFGHNEWKEYHSNDIVNLGRQMKEYNVPVNMSNVKDFVNRIYG